MASISSRINKDNTVTWRVNFRIDGRQCQESFANQKGAIEFGRLVDRVGGTAARDVLIARQSKNVGTPTLREYTAKYLDPESGLLTGIEDGTRAGYAKIAERSFLITLGDYPIDAIGKTEVGKWVTWQESQDSAVKKGEKVSSKTVHNYHAVLSSVLRSAVEEGLIDKNPAYKTRISKGQKHQGVFLSRDEFQTLLFFIPEHHKRFILFLAGTGCRWGEATALTWRDINYNANPVTVSINKAWKRPGSGAPIVSAPKSAKANRTISLWPELIDAIGQPGPLDDLVFKSADGVSKLWPARFRQGIWLPAVDKAMDPTECAKYGLTPLTRRPTPHDLRHTHASWLVASGAPLPFIQARMGHESITTTIGVYGHLLPDAHVQMAGMMQATMSGVLPQQTELTE